VVIFLVTRRVAQPRPTGYSAPNALAAAECAVGDVAVSGSCPNRRAARQSFRPSAFAELQTAAKPRTVGRDGQRGGLIEIRSSGEEGIDPGRSARRPDRNSLIG
jgi:hypothetical protein